MRFIVTRLPRRSYAARLMNEDGVTYDRAVVVSETLFGRHITLQLWIGAPLTVQQWRKAAADHFPRARTATIQRKTPTGYEDHFFRLQPPDWIDRTLAAFETQLRAYYGVPRR